MITEAEARKKWCPFVRLMPMNNATAPQCEPQSNRDGSWGTRCIASECMAWRKRAIDISQGQSRGDVFIPVPGASYATNEVKFVGFCGLAGAP